MKVTTDAIVFGALVDTSKSQSILDIGSGTGLLSLMQAQQSQAPITAVEIDQQAAEQSRQNIRNSPWPDQIQVIERAIQTYANNCDHQFDTIISNPPFFRQSLKGPNQQRNLARHTYSLSFSDLAKAISTLLKPEGEAWVLLPTDSANNFLEDAALAGLYPGTQIELQATDQRPVHRHILKLIYRNTETEIHRLIYQDQQQQYTGDFKKLAKAFYLNL